MTVIDLYSKRRKRELGMEPDVYTYDDFNENLRAQICYVIDDVLGIQDRNEQERNYGSICEVLRREYGVYKLVTGLHARASVIEELNRFISLERDIDRVR